MSLVKLKMYSLGGIKVNNIVCINLASRTDRKEHMIRQAKEKHFPLTFYTARYVEDDPERGRFQAHLSVIKNAKTKGYRNVLIFEDDAKIWTKSLSIAAPPDNWKMLYLGGNVQKVIEEDSTNTSEIWKRVHCLTTHAYIVRYYMYNQILQEAPKYIGKMSLEEFYCQHIHPHFATYMVTPELVTQIEGWSDVKKKHVTYNQILTKRLNQEAETAAGEALTEFEQTETEMFKDDNDELCCVLKSETISDTDLPVVTLITPTCNRPDMIDFMIWCFYKQDYPEDKLRWIIADDSDADKKVRAHFPHDDKRIKYVNCKLPHGQYLPLSKKLNLCLSYCGDESQIILHFFDFVYYNPKSTLSRVKALLQNPVKKCIGCTEFGVFDFETNKSYISYFPDANDNKTIMAIQSLGYWKSFWESRNFDETKLTLPSYYFIFGRMNQAVSMPYEFALISLQHSALIDPQETKEKNSKEDSKVYQKSEFSFYDTWDRETKEFILLLYELHKK